MKIKIPVIVVWALTVIGIVGLPAALMASNGMLPVKGTGMSYLQPTDEDPTTPDAMGQVQLTIGKKTYDLQVIMFVVGVPKESGKVMHLPSMHIISGNGVQFTTSDTEILIATKTPGLYKMNVNSEVVGGGTGHLTFHGTLNFATGVVSYEAEGAINLD